MTTGEVGGGAQILPEFAEIAERHMREVRLDDQAQQVVVRMLARGSAEVLRLPPGAEREEVTASAAARLDAAMSEASAQLSSVDYPSVRVDDLTSVMEGLCPVPPFCMGMGPDGEIGPGAFSDGPAYAVHQQEQVFA